MVTERQKTLLNSIIGDYIISAQPIASEFLEKKHRFGISSATIRNEMQKLTNKGYLFQPHTSAGRVPTDKGYRFFVDNLIVRQNFALEHLGTFEKDFTFEIEKEIRKELMDSIRILQTVTENLAEISSNLVLGYLPDLKILWKEGWEGIIREPEFKNEKVFDNFVKMINFFEGELDHFDITSDFEVYIGKENPFPKSREFSIIVSKCCLPKKKKGFLAITGPKRMDYNRNIGLINSLTKLLSNM